MRGTKIDRHSKAQSRHDAFEEILGESWLTYVVLDQDGAVVSCYPGYAAAASCVNMNLGCIIVKMERLP